MTHNDVIKRIQFLRARGTSPESIAEAVAAALAIVEGGHHYRFGNGGWVRRYLTRVEADRLWRLYQRQQCARLREILGRGSIGSTPPLSVHDNVPKAPDRDPETDLLIRREVAALLGQSPVVVDRLRREGILLPCDRRPMQKLHGRLCYVWRRVDVEVCKRIHFPVAVDAATPSPASGGLLSERRTLAPQRVPILSRVLRTLRQFWRPAV